MRAAAVFHAVFAIAAIVATAEFPTTASANSAVIIINADGPNEGFNDPTPRAPIGGNPGTTVGQQRFIAFQRAADIWGGNLDSVVPIRIRAAFDPLDCTSTSATLGSAGAIYVWSNFPGTFYRGVWYHEALANKLTRTDLQPPGDPTDPYGGADLNAQFNSRIGTDAGCMGGRDWYYGLDANHGSSIDLVTVLLHEFGHGLGFSSFVSASDGAYYFGAPGVFDLFVQDDTTGKYWFDMTTSERAVSVRNGRNVAWAGATVTSEVPVVLTPGSPLLAVHFPAAIRQVYQVGTAAFGPLPPTAGVTGLVVLALDFPDNFGPSTTDACSPITNPAVVAGQIALVDRGTCPFTIKAANVQAAGATAILIADNVADSPPANLGGVDRTIAIPSVRITQSAGDTIKSALGVGVSATLAVDMTVYSGADPAGRALLHTPNPAVDGSSISHWDPRSFRNQLMEPAISSDLTQSVSAPEDLTLAQLRDVGWFADADVDGVADWGDQCPGTVLGGNVVVGSCDSGVFSPLTPTGCSIAQEVAKCASVAVAQEDFTQCVARSGNALEAGGYLSGAQNASIQICAAQAGPGAGTGMIPAGTGRRLGGE